MPEANNAVNEYYARSFEEPTYAKIPERMREALLRYVLSGIHPGDFLTAVICNNLRAAVMGADDENIHLLREYLWWFYNIAPSSCHGSPEKFEDWLRAHSPQAAST